MHFIIKKENKEITLKKFNILFLLPSNLNKPLRDIHTIMTIVLPRGGHSHSRSLPHSETYSMGQL
jgi:hypothetical protein